MEAVHTTDIEKRGAITFPLVGMLSSERILVGIYMLVAFAALSIGGLLGPFQSFRRAPGVTELLGGPIGMPIFTYYYQSLTLHGVLNALVFTTFFIVGLSYFTVQRSLQRELFSMPLAWFTLIMMLVGVVLAGFAMIAGEANVLYTFYLPMLAHFTFYLGLVLIVVGTWLVALNIFLTYYAWRGEHKGEAVPLAVFAVLANFLMWFVATLGVATEILTMQLPMSLGLIQTTDAQVSRILFWFFGHPLVYFWLLPAYMAWYTMLPKQLGVKLFSDNMARIVFLMIMIFSIPIGVHHLFVDPGVSEVAKIFHSALTFVVAIPSLLTAFNIAATLERAGRKNGSKGKYFGLDFFIYLPWGNPVVAAQLAGMAIFVVAGITGIMNASFTFNVALHNTSWVVGHFHTTLAGAVTLTYFGIFYWMLPMLRGRKLFWPRVALAQIATWFVGMSIFGMGMGRAGIEGAIRRTDMGDAGAFMTEAWEPWLNLSAFGGVILLISLVLLYVVIVGTLFFSREPYASEAPIDTKAPTEERIPTILENWGLWLAVIAISNVIMWGPVLVQALDFVNGFWSVGWRP
jgi:cytochrome c oxidase subunit I